MESVHKLVVYKPLGVAAKRKLEYSYFVISTNLGSTLILDVCSDHIVSPIDAIVVAGCDFI